MLQIHSLLSFLLVEVAVLFGVLLSVWCFLALRRRKQDREGVNALIATIKEEFDQRKNALTTLLQDAGCDRAKVERRAAECLHQERLFYRSIIQTYLGRDAQTMSRLSASVEALLEPYRQAISDTDLDHDSAADSKQTDELSTLQEQNKSLAEELRITQETMNNMLSEYSQMFERGDSEVEETTAGKILRNGGNGELEEHEPEERAPEEEESGAEQSVEHPLETEMASPG